MIRITYYRRHKRRYAAHRLDSEDYIDLEPAARRVYPLLLPSFCWNSACSVCAPRPSYRLRRVGALRFAGRSRAAGQSGNCVPTFRATLRPRVRYGAGGHCSFLQLGNCNNDELSECAVREQNCEEWHVWPHIFSRKLPVTRQSCFRPLLFERQVWKARSSDQVSRGMQNLPRMFPQASNYFFNSNKTVARHVTSHGTAYRCALPAHLVHACNGHANAIASDAVH